MDFLAMSGLSVTDDGVAKSFSLYQADGPVADCLAPLLVVLDVDHTLICSRDQPEGGDYDYSFARGQQEAWVWKRPGLDAFLAWLRRPGVEVAVYTAASEAYAQCVLAPLDPNGTLFKTILSRADCVLEPPAKDVTRLGHDLRRTVLVDDSITSFRLQPDNGLPVSPFRHTDVGDDELRFVTQILEKLVAVEDVRPVLCDAFQLRASVNAKLLQGGGLGREAAAVYVSGASATTVNGRYVLRHGHLKCGRPVYIHEERPVYRILFSERGGSWVIDDGKAKEYRYAAVGRRDQDVPHGAEWSSCDNNCLQPQLCVTRPPSIQTQARLQAALPAKYFAPPPTLPASLAVCGTWCNSSPGALMTTSNYDYAELGLGVGNAPPWVPAVASAGA